VLKKLDEVDTEVNLWDFDKDAISFLSDQTGIKRLMKDEDLRKKVLLTTSEQKVIDK
jgi:oligoribonuclease NrnB/cAMP/cGMP phosphodiesterase (DHH superfamily)